jgi:small subunit ribosomal protein S8
VSISDPIADMLTRIRNGNAAKLDRVTMPHSNFKVAIADVMKNSGYIVGYSVEGDKVKTLSVDLKYKGKGKVPVIEGLKRISKPSCRIYAGGQEIPQVLGGLGIVILSTSQGIITGQAAKKHNIGGEVLCYVW